MTEAGRPTATENLKHKPLVEAILEIKWALRDVKGPNTGNDPSYRIVLGRFFEKVTAEYPIHEQLPAASAPDEFVAHMIQHRFRATANGWPLVQIGPGIMAINDAAQYTWASFQPKCEKALSMYYGIHPDGQSLRIHEITLRYIDSILFDYSKENICDFIRDKLKTNAQLPKELFTDKKVSERPVGLNLQFVHQTIEPRGRISVRFGTGLQDNKTKTILWESSLVSQGNDAPKQAELSKWLESAHNLTHEWFFKLIAGDLEKRFRGE